MQTFPRKSVPDLSTHYPSFRNSSSIRNSCSICKTSKGKLSYRQKQQKQQRPLPTYLRSLIHYPHMMLRHRDPHVVSFAPIDYSKHTQNTFNSSLGYDFTNIDDYIDYLHQHNIVKCVEKLSNNKIVFWIELYIADKTCDRSISWKWGGHDECFPTTIDKANEFVTDKLFYMASNICCIEQVFYTHIKNKNSFYSPYVITFDC